VGDVVFTASGRGGTDEARLKYQIVDALTLIGFQLNVPVERGTFFGLMGMGLRQHMRPIVLIVEPRREIAEALEEVVTSARYEAIVRPHIDCLSDLGVTPSAIIVRIAFESVGEPPHAAIGRLQNRPPVVAIAWEENEIAEAARLKYDVVLRAPQEIGRLCQALTSLVQV
jgi:hypothetical protein